MTFNIPVKRNEKLKQLLDFINADQELQQLWKCANINAVDRIGMNDHGDVHVRIVANAALRMLRLLMESGIKSGVEINHGLTAQDAELVVVAAACLHDIGISVTREDHERYSLILAYPKARQLLSKIYEEPALTVMVAEVLHAIIAHDADQSCLTLEAGVLKVADATDMTEGRSRITFEAGMLNIHSLSAQAIKDVKIEKGEERPLRLSITLNNSAGVFQLDNLLKHKLKNSTLAPYVEVIARMDGEQTEQRLFEVYKI
ncbi:MAG TPA: phosphohydrolase [Verrucomicrobia bacterium]|nr:MAG: phosphohydrolase [Lentisphaerae bacterium GWF2_57_35]HBA82778.1 phosphohydrolase [Verrucomicrobiota bacterium]